MVLYKKTIKSADFFAKLKKNLQMNGFKYVVSICVKIEYLCQIGLTFCLQSKAVHISNDKNNQDFEVLGSICFRLKIQP